MAAKISLLRQYYKHTIGCSIGVDPGADDADRNNIDCQTTMVTFFDRSMKARNPATKTYRNVEFMTRRYLGASVVILCGGFKLASFQCACTNSWAVYATYSILAVSKGTSGC